MPGPRSQSWMGDRSPSLDFLNSAPLQSTRMLAERRRRQWRCALYVLWFAVGVLVGMAA